jgi:predicted 3-demethylubiquinone-9 3-methyltransferase (glyoxalase superfamily)
MLCQQPHYIPDLEQGRPDDGHRMHRLGQIDSFESACGWLKDKYDLSWQILPVALLEMLEDHDTQKSRRTMEAMLQMKKLDIAALQRAFASES